MKDKKEALHHAIITFYTIIFPNTITGGTEALTKSYSEIICWGRSFTWTWEKILHASTAGKAGQICPRKETQFLVAFKNSPSYWKIRKNLSLMPRRWMQSSFSVLADISLNWNRSEFFPFKMEGGGKGSFCKSTTLSHQGLVTKLVHLPDLQADGWFVNRVDKQGRAEFRVPRGLHQPPAMGETSQ